MRKTIVSGVVAAVGIVACGEDDTGSAVCEAGRQEACACPDGHDGAQRCAADGSAWGECDCSVAFQPGGTGGAGPTGPVTCALMCQALAEQEVLAEEECSATIEEWVPSGSEYAGDEASCTSGCEELLAECPLEQQASLGCFWALDHESWFYCYQEETGEWSGTEVNEEPCAERLAALEACYGG